MKGINKHKNILWLKKRLPVLILILILIFVFFNSLLNGNESMKMSGDFKQNLYNIVGDKGGWWRDFLFYNLRSLAHFFEYFVLGLFLTGFYLFKKRTLNRLLKTAYILFSVALFDETIQIFSNRQSKVSDIWIDLFGAFFGMFFLKIVDMIIKSFKKHILNIKVKKNDKD